VYFDEEALGFWTAMGIVSMDLFWGRRQAFGLVAAVAFGLFSCTPVEDGEETGLEDSHAWSLAADNFTDGVLLSIFPLNEEEVWMVGGGLQREGPGVLVRYRPMDNTLCQEVLQDDKSLWWIHGADDSDSTYAVGEFGTVLHHRPSTGWVDESVDTNMTFYGVWSSSDAVWAVGGRVGGSATGQGVIWKKDDQGWSPFAEGLPGTLFKTWQGHFIGNQVAYRLDEKGELESIDPGEYKLLTLRGRSPSDLWAVGGAQAASVLRFDGESWRQIQTSGLGLPLMGVWTAPDEAVWVSGLNGIQGFSEDNGESWITPDYPVTSKAFHAVAKIGEEVLFVGGNMMSTSGSYHGTIGRYGPTKDAPSIIDCPL
jgi:hypothetical protein